MAWGARSWLGASFSLRGRSSRPTPKCVRSSSKIHMNSLSPFSNSCIASLIRTESQSNKAPHCSLLFDNRDCAAVHVCFELWRVHSFVVFLPEILCACKDLPCTCSRCKYGQANSLSLFLTLRGEAEGAEDGKGSLAAARPRIQLQPTRSSFISSNAERGVSLSLSL